MLVLEVSTHGDLPLEPTVANRAMVRQAFSMRSEVFSQMILAEESLLTHATLVRFNPCVPHFVTAHVRAVRKLHVADIALEELPVRPRLCVLRRHVVVVGGTLRHVGGQGATAECRETVATVAFQNCAASFWVLLFNDWRCGNLIIFACRKIRRHSA